MFVVDWRETCCAICLNIPFRNRYISIAFIWYILFWFHFICGTNEVHFLYGNIIRNGTWNQLTFSLFFFLQMTSITVALLALVLLVACNCGRCTSLTPCPAAFESCECRIPTVGLISIDCSHRNLTLFPVDLNGVEVSYSLWTLKLFKSVPSSYIWSLENGVPFGSVAQSPSRISAVTGHIHRTGVARF